MALSYGILKHGRDPCAKCKARVVKALQNPNQCIESVHHFVHKKHPIKDPRPWYKRARAVLAKLSQDNKQLQDLCEAHAGHGTKPNKYAIRKAEEVCTHLFWACLPAKCIPKGGGKPESTKAVVERIIEQVKKGPARNAHSTRKLLGKRRRRRLYAGHKRAAEKGNGQSSLPRCPSLRANDEYQSVSLQPDHYDDESEEEEAWDGVVHSDDGGDGALPGNEDNSLVRRLHKCPASEAAIQPYAEQQYYDAFVPQGLGWDASCGAHAVNAVLGGPYVLLRGGVGVNRVGESNEARETSWWAFDREILQAVNEATGLDLPAPDLQAKQIPDQLDRSHVYVIINARPEKVQLAGDEYKTSGSHTVTLFPYTCGGIGKGEDTFTDAGHLVAGNTPPTQVWAWLDPQHSESGFTRLTTDAAIQRMRDWSIHSSKIEDSQGSGELLLEFEVNALPLNEIRERLTPAARRVMAENADEAFEQNIKRREAICRARQDGMLEVHDESPEYTSEESSSWWSFGSGEEDQQRMFVEQQLMEAFADSDSSGGYEEYLKQQGASPDDRFGFVKY